MSFKITYCTHHLCPRSWGNLIIAVKDVHYYFLPLFFLIWCSHNPQRCNTFKLPDLLLCLLLKITLLEGMACCSTTYLCCGFISRKWRRTSFPGCSCFRGWDAASRPSPPSPAAPPPVAQGHRNLPAFTTLLLSPFFGNPWFVFVGVERRTTTECRPVAFFLVGAWVTSYRSCCICFLYFND